MLTTRFKNRATLSAQTERPAPEWKESRHLQWRASIGKLEGVIANLLRKNRVIYERTNLSGPRTGTNRSSTGSHVRPARFVTIGLRSPIAEACLKFGHIYRRR